MNTVNELEKAMDDGRDAMDAYLEITPTLEIIEHIREIKRKAEQANPEASGLKARILAALNET